MKKYLIALLIATILYSCGKDEDSKNEFPGIAIIDISQESAWDYGVYGIDDHYYVKKGTNNLPESVLFYSAQANKNYSIFFNESGQLDKVTVDDYIFIFRNFNENFVDLGIIYPNGSIELLREIETSFNWEALGYKSNLLNKSEDWSDVIRWTGRTVAGVPCALSVAATISSGGMATPIALWTCGNFILSLSSDIAANEFNIHNGFTDAVGFWGDVSLVQGCTTDFTGTGCLTSLAASGFSEWADNLESIENIRNDDVQITEAALEYGYGDVQITLTWDDGADLDLHVIDPYGEEIYYYSPSSSSGGKLDVDDINGYGPENIYWAQSQAPSGNYQVYVHDYNDNGYGTSNYTVLINAFGAITKYTGSVTYNQFVHIKDFDETGSKALTIPFKISTKRNKK